MSPADRDIKIDQLIRSKRKTISLEVKQDGRLVVRAPYLTTRGQIKDLVKAKGGWIRKKQELVKKQSLEVPSRKFTPGEQFLYLGKTYPLDLVEDQVEPLILKDKFYLAENFKEEGKLVFENWYRRHASQVIKAQVARRARQNGFAYTRVRITSARTRWGSCGSNGSLNFTWRLVMAPEEVIEYVVVHELVHLKIRNHSKAYWNEVSKMMSDYNQHLKWLKDNGYGLTLD
jgi:predicted metal-dependent hydrolase